MATSAVSTPPAAAAAAAPTAAAADQPPAPAMPIVGAGAGGSGAGTASDPNDGSGQPGGTAAGRAQSGSGRVDARATDLTQPLPAETVAPTPAAPSSGIAAVGAPVALAAPVATAPVAPLASNLPQRPVAAQLAGPIASLRTAGDGEHVMVIRVTPDTIGPVRVLAHFGAEGIRIELLGGTDQARDAVRAALPDLRRDLAGVGLQADLSLTSGGRDGSGSSSGSSSGSGSGSGLGLGDENGSNAPDETRRSGAGSAPPPEPVRAAGSRSLDITS